MSYLSIRSNTRSGVFARALLSLDKDVELDLAAAQKIFGYFDKSQLINLFSLILLLQKDFH